MVVAAINTLQPEDAPVLKRRLRQALRETLASYKVPQKVVVTDESVFTERFKRVRVGRT
jgi:hypothetical protein